MTTQSIGKDRFIGISRHRLEVDGDGVTTLIVEEATAGDIPVPGGI